MDGTGGCLRIETCFCRGLDEKFLQPCYSEVPKDESVPRPVCQHVPYERNPELTESVSKGLVTPNKSFLNPLAPEWESKPMIPFPTSLSDDCGTKSGTDRSDFSNLVQSLTSALTLGFRNSQLRRSPLEYWKFIRSFEVNVADITDDPRKKLTYLIQYCSGEAREVIENCCVLELKEGYERAKEILHHQFGRPHIVARAYINQLAKGQSIKPTDSAALQSLSRQMLKYELTLSQMGFDADLNNSETLLGIMDHLPPYLQRKWTERAETIFGVGKRPCFSDLTAFVQKSADTANNMFGLHLNEVPRRGTNFTVRGDELQGKEFWSSSPREDPGSPTRDSTRGRANESTRRSSRESI